MTEPILKKLAETLTYSDREREIREDWMIRITCDQWTPNDAESAEDERCRHCYRPHAPHVIRELLEARQQAERSLIDEQRYRDRNAVVADNEIDRLKKALEQAERDLENAWAALGVDSQYDKIGKATLAECIGELVTEHDQAAATARQKALEEAITKARKAQEEASQAYNVLMKTGDVVSALASRGASGALLQLIEQLAALRDDPSGARAT